MRSHFISGILTLVTPIFLSAGSIPTDTSQEKKPATIKVLLSKDKERILLEAKGSYKVYNPLTGMPITEGLSRKKGWLSASENGLIWGELIPGMLQMRIVPENAKTSVLVDGIEYHGCLNIYSQGKKIHVVNEIDVERYLKATLSTEFNEMDEEVLDAIAIAARTHAYYLSQNPTSYWHVDAREVGYQGYAIALQNSNVERSIDNTNYMVMTYQGTVFPASWTKNSAGKTAEFATIFRKKVLAPHGVESPFAAHDREKNGWSFSISKQELAKALGAVKVTSFDLYQDERSQKVYGARLKEGEKSLQFDFAKLQAALGNTRLKSNDFKVQIVGDKILFKGFGEGNSVGLCLFSAAAMADKGEKAPKILNCFFPETKLEKIRSINDL